MAQVKYTNKLRRVPILVRAICEALDTQEIRRLCRYFSLSPYDDVALDYNNEFVEQPDLMDSLLNHSVRDKKISEGADEPVVLPQRFSDDALTNKRVIIFVYCSDIVTKYGTTNLDYYFQVQICYPLPTEPLVDFKSRPWEIATWLEENIDGLPPKCEYLKELGNIVFTISGDIINGKLANNSEMGVLTVPIRVRVVSNKDTKFHW